MSDNSDSSSVLTSQVVFAILLVLVAASVFYFLYDSANDAATWQDFYSKQASIFMNSGLNGQEVTIDAQPIVKIAKRNGLDISRPESIFRFDALNNQVCAKAGKGEETCYPYFNQVAASDIRFEAGEEGMLLKFTIRSKEAAE